MTPILFMMRYGLKLDFTSDENCLWFVAIHRAETVRIADAFDRAYILLGTFRPEYFPSGQAYA
jgi:hypothetical protein